MWNRIGQLLMIPKGFGKFFPKGAASKASKGSAQTNAKKGGTGGGNAGGGGPGFNGPTETLMTLGLTGAVYAYVTMRDNDGKEISFQDFQTQLLESGLVDRIIVTNKNVAKVVLRTPEDPSLMQSYDQSSSSPLLANLRKFNQIKLGGLNNNNNDDNNQQMNGAINANANYESSSFESHDTSSDKKSNPSSDNNNNNNNTANNKFARYPRLGVPVPANAITPYYFAIGSIDSFEKKMEDAQKALNITQRDYIPVVYVNETNIGQEIMRLLPTIALIGAYFFIMNRMGGGGAGGGGGPGGIFKIGKSTAKKIAPESVNVTFADVAGCDEAKLEIKEFIDFLKEPKRFTDLGAKIPKGALLCGPPGTGKTMLAKATAGEANVPFYSVSGSDFVEMFVGVGPSRVRDLFKEARANAPCIVFIDEIDAVGRQRGKGGFSGGNDERENTLNQLLVEMDGFDTTANIVLLAGTNRVDVLDSALTRAGRFDRQITVDKPDLKGRKAIFEVHLKGINLKGLASDYSARLSALTPGMVGADIANMCNEAAIVAARRSKKQVDLDDFEKATDRLVGGLESNKIMSAEEKKVVAYHEAGHAVAGWNLKYADPLLKVTIVPRGSGALGYAQYLPKEIFLRTKEQILDIVCMALAGRAAEQITFGNVTTGAADDLRRVTQIVYQMVQVYGMNEKIGQISFPKEDNGGFGGSERLYSESTAEVMDEEVRAIIKEAYQRTIDLMLKHQDQVEKVAQMLLDKETITNGDVTHLIGPRPHSAGPEYEEYANGGWTKPVEELGHDSPSIDSDISTDDPLVPGFATKSPTY
jgi:AFG3 family protein